MTVLTWAVLALVAGFALVWLRARRARPVREPLQPGTELPATLLQRASWRMLGAGLLPAAGAAAVVWVNGAERTNTDDGVRLLFTLLLLLAIGGVSGATIWLRGKAGNEREVDERDRAILERAPAAQGAGVLVVLAVWVVGLAEQFWSTGAVPVFYLYLVFWSCLLVHLLALPVGIIAGYRRR